MSLCAFACPRNELPTSKQAKYNLDLVNKASRPDLFGLVQLCNLRVPLCASLKFTVVNVCVCSAPGICLVQLAWYTTRFEYQSDAHIRDNCHKKAINTRRSMHYLCTFQKNVEYIKAKQMHCLSAVAYLLVNEIFANHSICHCHTFHWQNLVLKGDNSTLLVNIYCLAVRSNTEIIN